MDVKVRGPELDPPAPKDAVVSTSAGSVAAAAVVSSSSSSAPVDTVVCVIAASGVKQNRVESNIEAMSEHGLIVLEQVKTELSAATARAFAVLPPSDPRQHAAELKAREPKHGTRTGTGTDIAIELANIPDAKNLVVELLVSRADKSVATQTETIAENPNPKFHTTLFVPAHPFEDESKVDSKSAPHDHSDVDYELRIFNRASAVAASAHDLLAVVPLDATRLSAGTFSVPLTNHSDTSLDTKLKQHGAVITVRTASSSAVTAHTVGGGARLLHRPDRVVIHLTAHNLPVTPPPKPTGAAAVAAAQAAAAAAAAGIPAPPEALGHSVVAVLTPVGGSGESQKTEAIIGVANPTFHVPFSVPRPDQVTLPATAGGATTSTSLYDLHIYAASTDPDVIAARNAAAGAAGAAAGARPAALGDILTTIRIDIATLLDSPAGCQTFRLINSKTTELAPDEQTVRVAPGAPTAATKAWAQKLANADASVTIVGVTTHHTEEGTYHQTKDELADVRAFTSGPVVCLLVRGENAFAKLVKLKADREVDHMYFSADVWCALRDSLLLFPTRGHGVTQKVERTLAIVKPKTSAGELDAILRALDGADFVIVAREKRVIDAKTGKQLFADAEEAAYVSSDVSEVLVLEAPGAVDAWQLMMGPEDPAVALRLAPTTLRGRFGHSRLENLVYGSPTAARARADIALLFRDPFPLQRTLALFKPDAVDASGDAMLRIATEQFGFTVLIKERLRLSKARAELFYAEHAGKPFFASLVEFMSSGPIMALVLTKPSAIIAWRKLIGPTRRTEALRTKPNSLRAQFGHSDTANACHGSADATDAEREIQFFFPQLPAEVLPTEVEQLKAVFNAKPFAARGPHARAPKSLNDVLVDGLTALCRERPLKLDAVKWLGTWLLNNNPNQPRVEHAVVVTAADAKTKKPVAIPGVKAISFDTKSIGAADRDEKSAPAVVEAASSSSTAAPPAPRRLVWVVGGPGAGKASLCSKLAKEFGYEHINVGAMLRANCKAGSDYAELLTDCMLNGRVVPSTVVIALLQHAMRSTASATARWLISDFPSSLDQAFEFEASIGPASQMIYLSVSDENTLIKRVERRIASNPASNQRADDQPASVQKRLALFREDVVPSVVGQFRLFAGKVKEISADGTEAEVYARLKQLFEAPKVVPVANGAGAVAGAAATAAGSPKRKKGAKKPLVAAVPPPPAPEFMKING